MAVSIADNVTLSKLGGLGPMGLLGFVNWVQEIVSGAIIILAVTLHPLHHRRLLKTIGS